MARFFLLLRKTKSLLAGTNIPVSSTVSIDGAQVWDVPIEHGDNATLLVEEQWYTTPILDDTTHTISITNFPHNFTFDYGIITVGSKTPLDGELLIVDDNDTNMVYHPSESWEHFTHTPTVPVPGPRGLLQSLPYNGGTKQMNSSTEDAPWVKFTFTEPQSQPAQDPAYNNGILAGFSMDDTPLGMPLGISPFLLPPSILHKPPPPVARRASTLTQPTVGNDPDIEYEQPSTRNWGGLRLNQDHEITPSDSDVAVMSPTPLQPQNPTETHLNARLRQLQELTLDIQREIVESISGAQRGVGSTLAGAGPMTGAVENDAHTTQPGSMLPPAYNYAEEAKSDNIRRFLEAASGSQ
ncbi:hypothetical protein DXG01_010343 [Tephrocybe rancida]|nr:hypothetical protein DXG01_010343 [Tephrocybe rancida]